MNINEIKWDQINWMTDQAFMWIIAIILMVVFAVILIWLSNKMRNNIHVGISRQIGEAFQDADGKKHLLYEENTYAGRTYKKKIKSGAYIEYFSIEGTTWDYKKHFEDKWFYLRKPTGIFDFKRKAIRFFEDPVRGLVPIGLSNPGYYVDSDTTLNEVISAVVDSLEERDRLYKNDFFEKYGSLLAVGGLIAFGVIMMLLQIKWQEGFWANSMNAMRETLASIKGAAAPEMP